MASRYWAVSLPVHNSASQLWNQVQERISKHSFDTPLYRFNIPNLRVGTLDSLLSLSDDLAKSNNFVEGVTQKIRRQIEELERVSGVDGGGLTVDGVPVDSYLTRFASLFSHLFIFLFFYWSRFVWDEAKYPTMSPLKEIVDGIHSQVAKIEDDLKDDDANCESLCNFSLQATMTSSSNRVLENLSQVRVSEYNNIRSQLNAINRKQTGSLAVRDLSNLVKPEDIITSENLTTLLAIVSKYSQKDWLSSYETLTDYVVPRSSKKLYEDNEYALYTVTLFSRVVENYRTSAREKGFQIRDFEYSQETHENRKQELDKLVQDQERLRASLLQWCFTSYGEVFSSWMHFCAVRLFAESILRYGLPPSFLACVLAPSVKSEKKVRSILEALSDSTNRQPLVNLHTARANVQSAYWKIEDEVGAGMAGLAGDSDAHPYVSFTINLA
ncbi:hypothetical protein ACSQ67_000781 [Phaseolus vulgaris]